MRCETDLLLSLTTTYLAKRVRIDCLANDGKWKIGYLFCLLQEEAELASKTSSQLVPT